VRAGGNSCGIEEWRSFAAPFFDVVPTGAHDAFCGHARSNRLGRLVVSEVGFDAAAFDRDPIRLAGFDTEFLLLETYDKGSNRGRSGDIETRLDSGALHIFDMARPWRTQSTEVACRSVVIPYDVVGYDPSLHPAYARLERTSPRTAMLLAGMGALFEAGCDLNVDEVDAIEEGFGGLVKQLMFPKRDRDGDHEHRGNRGFFVRKFIDKHLADADLGPQRISEALGVSRAALYRMLPEEGGVRSYIVARRLDRCFDNLRRGPAKRGRVRAVAERWGFFDTKSFNRAFRARFGMAPSDCMDQFPDREAGGIAPHPVNDWMRCI
jgi:AraC-like DNA-binding protein